MRECRFCFCFLRRVGPVSACIFGPADRADCWCHIVHLCRHSLIVSSQFEPLSIIRKLLKTLGGSAQIVVHSPTIQVSAVSGPPRHRKRRLYGDVDLVLQINSR